MKKLVSVLLIAAMAFSLAACSEKKSEPASGTQKEEAAGGESSGETVTLRFSTMTAVDAPSTIAANKIAETVEKETNGTVKIEVYPANQLGDWTQVYDELMMGSIDMAINSVPDTYDARISAGFLPYLAYNYEELRKVFAPGSFINTQMQELEAAQNIQFFGYFCDGFSGVGSNKEVKNANVSNADKGILIRVPGVDAWKFPFDRLGFRTSTIPYSDTYAALQTGVVDGWTGSPAYTHYMGYRDIEKYYYCYDAVHESTQILMSAQTWNKLSPEQQEAVKKACETAAAESIDNAEKTEEEYRQKLKDAGIQVIEFTDEEKKAIADDVREYVWGQLEDAYGADFLQGLRDSLN